MLKPNSPFRENGTTAVMTEPTRPTAERDVTTFYQRADALYRCATECCRQHERFAHLVRSGASIGEQRAARSLVLVCDEALADMASAYEAAAATRACAESDGACCRAANGLWMAGREFARRQLTSTRAGRGLGDGRHTTERFAELTLDYDLEASALLALKQATEAYRKVRPQV
jgi:hypothetical protein